MFFKKTFPKMSQNFKTIPQWLLGNNWKYSPLQNSILKGLKIDELLSIIEILGIFKKKSEFCAFMPTSITSFFVKHLLHLTRYNGKFVNEKLLQWVATFIYLQNICSIGTWRCKQKYNVVIVGIICPKNTKFWLNYFL